MSFTLGFKALAYPVSDHSSLISPCQCSLAFRCDHSANQATLLLIATIPTVDVPQTFAVQYDADKLLPGAVSLTCGNDQISQLQLDELMRVKGASSDIRTLAIHVAQPCPVWCSASQVFTHKPGSERPFQTLVELTKATSVHIVFDYKYLQKQYHGMFRAFTKASKSLGSFPVERLLVERGLRKASWDIFSPVDTVGAPPIYKTSRKRSREANSTSPTRSLKRLAPQSPTQSHTSEKTVPLSPALAEAFERRFLKTSPALDNQTEAIDAAVAKQLPQALAQVLPNVLRDVLPSLFISASTRSKQSSPRASFTSHTTPSKPPHTSFSSETSPPRTKLPKLSSLGHALLPHLSTHLADQFAQYQAKELAKFRKLLDELYDSAEGDRAHETALMMEDMEDHKADMLILREDAVDELNKQISEVFEQGRQEASDVGHELTERLQLVFDEVCGTIDGLKRSTLRRLVASEVRSYQRGRRVPKGMSKRPKKCGKRMLGKRREVESDWEDVDSFTDDDFGGFIFKSAKCHV